MSNSIKTRIRLKPDSPDHWAIPPTQRIGYYNFDIDLKGDIKPKKSIQLDADTVINYFKDSLNIRLNKYQEETLRKFISARNEGKELIFKPARQNGITTMRNYMMIIESLYND